MVEEEAEAEAEEEAEPRGSSVLILHLFRWVSFPEVTRGLTAFLIIFFSSSSLFQFIPLLIWTPEFCFPFLLLLLLLLPLPPMMIIIQCSA